MMILSGKWNQTKLGQKLNNEWVDFVKGCLTVDKAARSSISDVLNHKVFNGMKTV
ncbi:hypothetical protein NADFUDRAFT_81105 [Nadsonia fulvescens var. elongata DSM 6958]|uniref:Protein kinase domain-containing protein n=1 Tax=Nadsonia fulvescens var. elongata DSM 6958 TaxID=857566 RepID=A0A1E3PRQ1_9ASCO|nr:hypothetical protein NADFUDRAFT_81105 [Nadsonia fulvescens var. elongata DSM 6958]